MSIDQAKRKIEMGINIYYINAQLNLFNYTDTSGAEPSVHNTEVSVL